MTSAALRTWIWCSAAVAIAVAIFAAMFFEWRRSALPRVALALQDVNPELARSLMQELELRPSIRQVGFAGDLEDRAALASIGNLHQQVNSLTLSEWRKGFCSPLHCALYLGQRETAMYCARNGLMRHDTNQCRASLLDLMATKSDASLVSEVSKQMRSADVTGALNQMTMVDLAHLALLYGRPDVCHAAIVNGAAIDMHVLAGLGSISGMNEVAARGATYDDSDGYENTVLHFAAASCDREALQFVLDRTGSRRGANRAGETALHVSARCGFTEGVELLIAHGLGVECKRSDGALPIHLAVESGNLKCMRCLLAHGAGANAMNNEGWSCLHFAAKAGHREIASVLLDCGADVNGQIQAYRWTVSVEKYRGGYSALHLAAESGFAEVVDELISRGANANVQTSGSDFEEPYTALQLAVREGHENVVLVLMASPLQRSDVEAAILVAERRYHTFANYGVNDAESAWAKQEIEKTLRILSVLQRDK